MLRWSIFFADVGADSASGTVDSVQASSGYVPSGCAVLVVVSLAYRRVHRSGTDSRGGEAAYI